MSRLVVNQIQAKVGGEIEIPSGHTIRNNGTSVGFGVSTATDTLPSEGGAATTIVAQGLIKQRLYHNLVAETTKDSVNVSTVTDINTGRIGVNLTSPYTSLDTYQAHGYGNGYNGDSFGGYNTSPCKVKWGVTNTTSLYDFTNHVNSGYIDGTYMYCFSLGDLA